MYNIILNINFVKMEGYLSMIEVSTDIIDDIPNKI